MPRNLSSTLLAMLLVGLPLERGDSAVPQELLEVLQPFAASEPSSRVAIACKTEQRKAAMTGGANSSDASLSSALSQSPQQQKQGQATRRRPRRRRPASIIGEDLSWRGREFELALDVVESCSTNHTLKHNTEVDAGGHMRADDKGLVEFWAAAHRCVADLQHCSVDMQSFLYHNLALRAQKFCRGQAGIVNAEINGLVRLLFTRAGALRPSNGKMWHQFALFENGVGNTQESLNLLLQGAARAADPHEKAELYYTLGTHLHDHRVWEQSYWAFVEALKISEAHRSSVGDMSLRAACQVLYLGHYLTEWDLVDRLRLPTLSRLRASLDQSERLQTAGVSDDQHLAMSGPELHPWISIILPMPPELRLRIAHRFWQVLRVQATTPVSAGGLGVVPPNIAPHAHPSRIVIEPRDDEASPLTYRRRLRVGFASADFKQKATAYLCLGQFRYFNRSRVEIFLYASTSDPPENPSEWRRQLRSNVDHFREVHRDHGGGAIMSSAAASAMVAADHLDILVDLDGYSNEGLRRSELFAVRHAPVTVAWFVYMSTLGNPEVDYIVGDRITMPEATVAQHISGKVIYLPASFFPNSQPQLFPLHKPLFGIDPALDKDRDDMGLPYRSFPMDANGDVAGGFVFATFNKHLKIRSELFSVWADVLRRQPESVLWMLRYPADSEPRLRARARQLGVEEQLRFADFVSTSEENWLRLWRGADAVLDTTIYGAHTGAVDALWAGIPVVTCVGRCVRGDEPASNGDQMASRVAASMLVAIGLGEELIAKDLREYGEKMVRLATDREWYNYLRSHIEAARATSPLWDAELYANRFVDGLFLAYEEYQNGRELRHVYVP